MRLRIARNGSGFLVFFVSIDTRTSHTHIHDARRTQANNKFEANKKKKTEEKNK